jgi:oxygen-dependent protoporphyrinogen oxidase
VCTRRSLLRRQIWILEKQGGSLVGGAIKLFQDRRANPPPPRDERLPPKPKGQTVGSFRNGLQTLPNAIGAKLGGEPRPGLACTAHGARRGRWGGPACRTGTKAPLTLTPG